MNLEAANKAGAPKRSISSQLFVCPSGLDCIMRSLPVAELIKSSWVTFSHNDRPSSGQISLSFSLQLASTIPQARYRIHLNAIELVHLVAECTFLEPTSILAGR